MSVQLKILQIDSCDGLKHIVAADDDKTEKNWASCTIHNLPKSSTSGSNCRKLKSVFSASAVGGLPQLEVLKIEYFDELDQIIEDIVPSAHQDQKQEPNEIVEDEQHPNQLEIFPENTSLKRKTDRIIQEGPASEGATVKTLSTGIESIDLGGDVATHTKSSDRDIVAQDSQVVEQDDKLDEGKTGIIPCKKIQIQEGSNLMDKKEIIGIVSNNSVEHFADLDDAQIALLVEAIAAYPHFGNACEKFGERFQAWMMNTLADMLLFLRNESVVSVTPEREKEFHRLCDEVVQLGFERSWVDEMRQRVVARDSRLEHAQARIGELHKRRDHLTQELHNVQNELKSLYDFVDAQTKCFDFLYE
ncbi:hypothetical protein CR513_34788, partial [Mucuna pruriens]